MTEPIPSHFLTALLAAGECILATKNPGKVLELERVLAQAHLPVQVRSLFAVEDAPDIAETGATFRDNARLKAHGIAQHYGLPAIADDSGITVAALNGMPGVFSARWSGGHGDDAANTALLLAQIADVPDERRQAAFECAVVCALPEGAEVTALGTMSGTVAREPRGDGGFGYDPIFVPDGMKETVAELSPEAKDAISHRGQALRSLMAQLSADSS